MKTFHPSSSVSRRKPSAHRTTFLKRAASDKQPEDSLRNLVGRLSQCRSSWRIVFPLVYQFDRLTVVRKGNSGGSHRSQRHRSRCGLLGTYEVVNKGLHHWIGCPLRRLQHTDVEVRRQKCDRIRVIVPQLIDDQRFVGCLIVGSKSND